MPFLAVTGLAAAALLNLAPAHAGDAIGLEIVRKGQEGSAKPALILVVNQPITNMRVRVDCGGAWVEHTGGARKGQRIKLEFEPSVGSHQCSGKLSATFDDGSGGDMPLSFQVDMLPPLQIQVPYEGLATDSGTMQVVIDRPAKQVHVAAFGIGGTPIGEGTAFVPGTPAGTPIDVEWTGSGEVINLVVTATDENGFWTKLELSPWFYSIPHEDVIFETAQYAVLPSEDHKLEEAMKEVQDVLHKYGATATIHLYVGGYTDTQGSSTSNITLSNRRATAIAQWFKAHGFPGTIYAQGFGERGQAVPTPDETDEARNRRAVYLLAADTPPVTRDVPGSDWRQVK